MADEQKEGEDGRRLVVPCEVCGQPLRVIRWFEDGWAAECSDPDCRALHENF